MAYQYSIKVLQGEKLMGAQGRAPTDGPAHRWVLRSCVIPNQKITQFTKIKRLNSIRFQIGIKRHIQKYLTLNLESVLPAYGLWLIPNQRIYPEIFPDISKDIQRYPRSYIRSILFFFFLFNRPVPE